MSLAKILDKTRTEEELKHIFSKFFHLKLDTKNFIDLYTPQILFEFKLDAPLNNVQTRATCIAQTLYYIRRLKFGLDSRAPSENICVVTKNSAIFFPTKTFFRYYRGNYDWDLAPSSPCKKLVATLMKNETISAAHVYDFSNLEDESTFIELIKQNLVEQLILFDQKEINEQNFYSIFQLWAKIFGVTVENGRKSSEYFITDIEEGKSQILGNSVLFRMSSGELVEKFLNIAEYKHFWSVYEKISEPRAVIAIRQKMDRMSEINMRRFTGEFFTPITFAQKAVEYLLRTVNFLSGEYRIWDMAAGTGNLEFALPAQALKYCYISTLLDDDADYCRKIFPEATVFQYDYLNDDVEFFSQPLLEKMGVKRKMPQKLANDLKNPAIKWIIFINPPYATSGNFSRDKDKVIKCGVADTLIRKLMNLEGLGRTSTELVSQFLYRINIEFKNKMAYLGIFSKIKYLNANADQKLREKVFRYKFERGFIFSSKNFEGCKANFPVGFLIWNLDKIILLDKQNILLDVYNPEVEKIAEKKIYVANKNETLNNWIVRPPNKNKFPPMKSGLNFGYESKNRNDLVAENFLASFMCMSNDFVHQNYTTFLSGPYSSGGISVTAENFEQCMIVHMVRRLPKATWLNDRDQFLQPLKKLSSEFISDAVIWSLFAHSNQTVSLRNVEYDGEIYRLRNNFFPFTLSEIRNWRCSSPDIRLQIEMAKNDRFAAIWIENHEFSAQATDILNSARELYKKFYAELTNLDIKRWKIEDWDAGWYQVRMSLGESVNLEPLSEKLLPQIYDLGFLRDKVHYF